MGNKIRANRIVYYATAIHQNREDRPMNLNAEKNLIQNKDVKEYNGYLSDSAKRRIKEIVPNMLLVTAIRKAKNSRGKKDIAEKTIDVLSRNKPLLSFLTLTLSSKQIHGDNEIKRECLQPFLASLKDGGYLINYIWVAETQRNGNVHFHLCVNSYIDKDIIRNLWNRHQNKLGYVDRYGKENPPSTQIDACRDVTKVAAYISKYMCKSSEVVDNTNNPNKSNIRKIEGRLWGCDTQSEKMVGKEATGEEQQRLYKEVNKVAQFIIEEKYYTIMYIDIKRSKEMVNLLVNHFDTLKVI